MPPSLYDLLVPFISSRARRWAMEELDVTAGMTVLDAGTGTGRAIPGLAALGAHVVGVDVDPAMLRVARRRAARHKQVTCRTADITDLPFADGAFDAVLCAYVLDVLPPPLLRAALGEIRRVLAPRGRLAAVAPAVPHTRPERAWVRLMHTCPRLMRHAQPLPLSAVLTTAGFSVDRAKRLCQWGLASKGVLARNSQ